MARKKREYRFKIEAFTPETMPMARLAEYLRDLSTLLGQDKSVHLIRVEDGSTVPVMLVEWEAEPKVLERLRAVRHKDAPAEVLKAAQDIDRRLAEDNAKVAIIDPIGTKVIAFPGRERVTVLEYGPFNQLGTLVGIPIRVGGELDPVPVHLDDGEQKYICWAKRILAKEIAAYLFTSMIRVEGSGRWMRHGTGQWELVHFTVSGFKPLQHATLRDGIERLRAIRGAWKELEDPLGELDQIRHGPKVN